MKKAAVGSFITMIDVVHAIGVCSLAMMRQYSRIAVTLRHRAPEEMGSSGIDRRMNWSLAQQGNQQEEAEMAEKTRYGIFKVIVTCTHCGNPVVVNGPLTAPVCPSCRRSVSMPAEVWADMVGDFLADYKKTKPGSGGENTMMTGGLTVRYSAIRLPPPDPACPDCEENWDLGSIENGFDGVLHCHNCPRTTPVFPAPSWLRAKVPQARQVFFAEREGDEHTAPDPAAKPIALTCPQCGGGLLVTGETERTVPCKYCKVDVYLPDGVWKKLHPAKTAKYWMIRFQGDFSGAAE